MRYKSFFHLQRELGPIRGHFVYRMYDTEGGLLYVGVTEHLGKRLKQHYETKPWINEVAYWEYEGGYDKGEAVREEHRIMREFDPPHNTNRMRRNPPEDRTTLVQVFPDEAEARSIEERAPYLGGGAGVVRTDLGRYRALVRGAQTRLAREGVFTEAEGSAILDALNGTLLVDRPETLAASVEDAIRLDGLAEKWGVDAGGLAEKLRGLTPLELHAVADRAETFWALVPSGGQWDIEGGLFGARP